MIGLGSGGLFGVGLGQGVQKIFYLPEAHTDMIFAIIGEELGLVGSTAVIAAYGAFAYAGLRIALALPRPVRQAARGRADGARLRPGGDQPRGRDGPRAADRDPAAVRLLRRLEPRGRARLASASSLTSRASMARAQAARCLIAAGGTAGHVLPALAVAEALRGRGAA